MPRTKQQSPEKTGILLVAYGSSTPVGEQTLHMVTEKARAAFPGIPVRWALTSPHVRTRLAHARKKTDSVLKALCRMGFERYTRVAVQSLHLIPGREYETLLEEAESARSKGGPALITVGAPLLRDTTAAEKAAKALLAHLPEGIGPSDAVVCMGHGTWHSGAAGYEALSRAVKERDPRIVIGTLSGRKTIEQILPGISADGPKTVWLLPLLAVVGTHAERDMAGDQPDSWKSRLEKAGLTCRPVLKGTAQYEGFVDIWLGHLAAAMRELECAAASEP